MSYGSGILTLGIFMVIQLVAAIWWAATMNTKMDFMLDMTKGTKEDLAVHVAQDFSTFSTKSEIASLVSAHDKEMSSAVSLIQKELSALWKKVDTLTSKKEHV